jgi:prepilin-type N-terminal cleavage/methylation domain-containing protein
VHRPAFSLIEILFVLVIVVVLAAFAFPRYVAVRDRASVRSAVTASIAAFDAARTLALTRGRHAAVRVDTLGARLVVHSFRDTVLRVPLGTSWGVRVSASRDSSAIAPDGLGYGAANLSLILSRGAAADTVTVSRLGRVARR